MDSRNLLPLLGAVLLAAMFWPADPDAENAGNSVQAITADGGVPVGSAESTITDQDMALGDEQGVTLTRYNDGHFYANVDVDGADIRFMVDTGATGLALTGEDAQALGLSWTEDELQMVARGASGSVRGKNVILRSVDLGGIHAENIQASIIPEGLPFSLLGQSFLSKAESVSIRGDQMVLN